MQKTPKRTAIGSINNFYHQNKVDKVLREQLEWAQAWKDYARAKNALNLANKVRHGATIDYWKKRIKDMETKYPQLLKDFHND